AGTRFGADFFVVEGCQHGDLLRFGFEDCTQPCVDGDQVVQARSSKEVVVNAQRCRGLGIGKQQIKSGDFGRIDAGVPSDFFDDVDLTTGCNDGHQVVLAVKF